MKKILLLNLLFGYAYLHAAPVLDAPPPPEVMEPELNFSEQEFARIKSNEVKDKQLNNDINKSNRDEKGALIQSLGDSRDGVKVIQLGNDTIEEYYRGGQVYQIRVIPKVGKPYSLSPENEHKNLNGKGKNPTSNWKILSF